MRRGRMVESTTVRREPPGTPAVGDDLAREYMTTLSNWGRWGEDDVRGTLNFIDQEAVRAGVAASRSGRVVRCGRPVTTRPVPGERSPLMHHMLSSGTEAPPAGMHSAYDWFGMGIHGHAFTHLDSLGHVFWDGKFYNGRPATLVETIRGARAGSIEPAAGGIVGRGVLLDVPRVLGCDYLEPGTAIGPDLLDECEEALGLRVAKGDILLVRGGRDAVPPEPPSDRHAETRAGLHASCLPWIHDRQVAVLGSDDGNDVAPSQVGLMRVPIHVVGIVAMGLWLLDNADLEALAAACAEAEQWTFLFTMAPLDLKNATGSPVNPLVVL